MRQVRVVVAIVMVHEVKQMRKTVPCDEFIREKKVAEQKKRKEGEEEGEEEGKRKVAQRERRRGLFDSLTSTHLFRLFLFFSQAEGTIHPSIPLSLSLPAPIDIDKCDSTDRNPSSPITNCPNECTSTNKAW
jgi:hypothetical protein